MKYALHVPAELYQRAMMLMNPDPAAWQRQPYTYVADIVAPDLEAAYDIGQQEGRSGYTTIVEPPHVVTVGDVLVDDDGKAHMVMQVGFYEM